MANQVAGDTPPRRSLHDLLGLLSATEHDEHDAAVDKTNVRLAPGGLGPGGAVSVGREHNEPDQAPLTPNLRSSTERGKAKADRSSLRDLKDAVTDLKRKNKEKLGGTAPPSSKQKALLGKPPQIKAYDHAELKAFIGLNSESSRLGAARYGSQDLEPP
jgi:hypothetical protein